MNGRGSVYPESGRSAWILARRPVRSPEPDPWKPHAVFREQERLTTGEVVDSGVVLLTNRECPWRCLMCDLWKGTTRESVPTGVIVRQVETAVQAWTAAGAPPPVQVKLYNSGSFFDAAAIPEADYAPVAERVAFARRVVVESHPLLIGERARRLRDLLAGSLEVAMGLETAHPEALRKLNKGFDAMQFARAAERLADANIALRVFLLVHPPFVAESEALDWVVKSAAFAYDCGASAVTLIPTRLGNGALDRLHQAGEFEVPTLTMLEAAQQAVLELGRGRVFADTWALDPFAPCPACRKARRARLEAINLEQLDRPRIGCEVCGEA